MCWTLEGVVTMAYSRFVIVGAALATFAAMAGCGSTPEKESLDAVTAESELKLSGARYLGQISSGQTKTANYEPPPTYRSYGFNAKGGDDVTVDIKSDDGDAIGWITDSTYKVLAGNDDANKNTLDAKIKYRVPAGASRPLFIVFRDFDSLEASFKVTLGIVAKEQPKTCSYNGKVYNSGASFDSTDGCNKCTCSDTGSVGCTKMACACNPSKEPKRSYRYTPQQCMVVRYTCPTGQAPFSNACGCGCELP